MPFHPPQPSTCRTIAPLFRNTEAAAEEEARLAKRREKFGIVEPIVKPTPKPKTEKTAEPKAESEKTKEEVPVEAAPAAKTEPDEKLLARQKVVLCTVGL